MNNKIIKETYEYKEGEKAGREIGYNEGQKQIISAIESYLKGEESITIRGYFSQKFDELKKMIASKLKK